MVSSLDISSLSSNQSTTFSIVSSPNLKLTKALMRQGNIHLMANLIEGITDENMTTR
jgi:hypothetical protein